MTMTEDETKSLMERYGITATQQSVFHYQGFKYGNLTDALNQAELVATRANAAAGPKPEEKTTAVR
jgi:hypothetical protein